MKQGQLVLLLSKENSYLVSVSKQDFNTRHGLIHLADIQNQKKNFGDKIKTSTGYEFILSKPNLLDILQHKIKRTAQVILPKDVALILAYTGISPDSLVVDAGTGTGYLAIFLANYLPKGKIITYEKDKRFWKSAEKNFKTAGFNNIQLKKKDFSLASEKNVDLVTLDLENSAKAISRAYKILRHGGWLVVYSPTADSLIKVRKEIVGKNFIEVKTVENIVREWQMTKTVRPKTIGLMHTGFITFARKI